MTRCVVWRPEGINDEKKHRSCSRNHHVFRKKKEKTHGGGGGGRSAGLTWSQWRFSHHLSVLMHPDRRRRVGGGLRLKPPAAGRSGSGGLQGGGWAPAVTDGPLQMALTEKKTSPGSHSVTPNLLQHKEPGSTWRTRTTEWTGNFSWRHAVVQLCSREIQVYWLHFWVTGTVDTGD